MILSQTRSHNTQSINNTTLPNIPLPYFTWPSLYITMPELFVSTGDAAYPLPDVKTALSRFGFNFIIRLCRGIRLGGSRRGTAWVPLRLSDRRCVGDEQE